MSSSEVCNKSGSVYWDIPDAPGSADASDRDGDWEG